MTIATPFVNNVNWFNISPYPIASFLDFRNGSIFCIFPFTTYLFYGMAFGAKLKQVNPMKRIDFIIISALILTPVFYIIGHYIFKLEWSFIQNTPIPYKASAGYIFTRFSVVTVVLALTGFITKKLMHLQDYFTFFGQKALYVYVLHFFVLFGQHSLLVCISFTAPLHLLHSFANIPL